MSGWIPPSRRHSGLARRRRSCSTSSRFSHHSGEPLRPSSAEGQPTSALKNTSSFLTALKEKILKTTRSMRTTRGIFDPVKSIRTQRRSPASQTPWIWTTTKKRCCRSAERGSQTPRERRPRGSSERSCWRRPTGCPSYRKPVNSKWRASMSTSPSRTKMESIIAQKYRSRSRCLRADMRQEMRRRPRSTFSNPTFRCSKSSKRGETKRRSDLGTSTSSA